MRWAYSFQQETEGVRSGLAVIAGIVVSLGVISAPFFRPIKRRIARRRVDGNATLAATIAAVMRPELDGIRTAARSQHDEQNRKMADGFAVLGARVDDLARTVEQSDDAKAEHLARHDVEIAVLQARDPNARSRKDDL